MIGYILVKVRPLQSIFHTKPNYRKNGLAMRKEYLDQYLSDNNLALVFYSLGEKYIIQKGTYQSMGQRYDLSGAYCYHDNSFDEIQPMHISNTL